MSTFQRDELLTQSEILDKETSPLAKEANHGQDLWQNGGEAAAAMLLISRSAGLRNCEIDAKFSNERIVGQSQRAQWQV